VQAVVARAMGPVAGFKTGRKPDGEHMMAPIYASMVRPDGAAIPCAPTESIGIELEVGFRLTAPPPPLDAPDYAGALRAVLQPVVVIEIVDTRLAGPMAALSMAQFADSQINAGIVVGPDWPDWPEDGYTLMVARMQAGDQVLVDGPVTPPGGDAFQSVLTLARAIGEHCGGLCQGQIVISGSLHPLTYVPAGTEVTGYVQGLGAVTCTIG
jgi:2-keto-4-pentenoate hydratase